MRQTFFFAKKVFTLNKLNLQITPFNERGPSFIGVQIVYFLWAFSIIVPMRKDLFSLVHFVSRVPYLKGIRSLLWWGRHLVFILM